MPLFASTVILGNMAGLRSEVLTKFVASFLAIRLAYTATYATTSTQGPTLIRTGLYFASVALCFQTLIEAAKALGGTRL